MWHFQLHFNRNLKLAQTFANAVLLHLMHTMTSLVCPHEYVG